jgi:hypothetical protein
MHTLTDTRNDLTQAISRGIDFLYSAQMPSGAFPMFVAPHPLLQENCQLDHSTFPTAQISYCLDFTKSEKAGEMLQKAIRFFLDTMQKGGVWRYTCGPADYLPPDVDDTACISFLLRRHGISFPDNTGVMLGNRDSRGLFYTWIVPRLTRTTHMSYWRVALRQLLKRRWLLYYFPKLTESRSDDFDPVINANVLHYLGERPETLPIIRHLIQITEEQTEETCDKYYASRFTFYYFLSRNHAAGIRAFGPLRDTIVGRIKSYAHPDGSIGSHILHTALAACALMDWQDWEDHSRVLNGAIEAILRGQHPSGGWQKFPFYFSGPVKKLAWGSEELTTGFCLEALSRYRNSAK